MEPEIQTCVDVLLSDDELNHALQLSQEHNPANRPGPFELGGASQWLWKAGETLRVSWLGGDASLDDRVKRHAQKWCEYGNIVFEFLPYVQGRCPEAEIRVAFVPNNRSWSYIGTQALHIQDQCMPTMNFGWLTAASSEEEVRRVVLHEFGHALGCIHEHLHPKEGIPWDRPAVYAYYAQQGWSSKDVDNNLFTKYGESMINGSDYDPLSIMHYQIVAALRLDRQATPQNTELSAMDKAHIQVLYPYD